MLTHTPETEAATIKNNKISDRITRWMHIILLILYMELQYRHTKERTKCIVNEGESGKNASIENRKKKR